jgi:DNA-directed RNA polymerase subunit RPC12/RpoP
MLITCGKCGNDVSDKALACPKCKTPVKPISIACPECGKEMAEKDLGGDCPHCGYPLSYLRTKVQLQAVPRPKPNVPAPQPPTYPPPADIFTKKPPMPKSLFKGCLERVFLLLIALMFLSVALFLTLKFDIFGVKSSLRNASTTEETVESLSESMADVRLWIKHAINVVLDQFPDDVASGQKAGVEGRSR